MIWLSSAQSRLFEQLNAILCFQTNKKSVSFPVLLYFLIKAITITFYLHFMKIRGQTRVHVVLVKSGKQLMCASRLSRFNQKSQIQRVDSLANDTPASAEFNCSLGSYIVTHKLADTTTFKHGLWNVRKSTFTSKSSTSATASLLLTSIAAKRLLIVARARLLGNRETQTRAGPFCFVFLYTLQRGSKRKRFFRPVYRCWISGDSRNMFSRRTMQVR